MTQSETAAAATRQPYWCFISYRHADNKQPGRQWATWLHQQIETYEVPEDLVGSTNERGEVIPERIFPVFRDEEELPADAELGSPIFRALDRSYFLLVLCSPQAVQSTYVEDEILYFKKLGRANRVLAAMLEGEPNASWDIGKQDAGVDPMQECFPKALQFTVDEAGDLDLNQRAEPIAADFRLADGAAGWTSPEAYRQALTGHHTKAEINAKVHLYQQQCELAKLKIIAGILGLPLGTLTKRDKAYQLEKERGRARIFRRVAAALGVLAVLAIVAGIFAVFKQREAVANEAKAEAATEVAIKNQARAETAEDQATQNLERAQELLWQASYNTWNEAVRSQAEGDPQAALAYLASGMRSAPANTGLVTYASSVLANASYPIRALNFELPVANVAFMPDGASIIVAELVYSQATRYSLWDPIKVERLDHTLVPTNTNITAAQRLQHPWLAHAPATRPSTNEQSQALKPRASPAGFRQISVADNGLAIEGLGVDSSHPWFADGKAGQPGHYALPNSQSATGYAWNPSGTQVVSAHGFIDAVSEQKRGQVLLWDLRQPLGISLYPDQVTPFAQLNYDNRDVTRDGDFELHHSASGFAVHRAQSDQPLWQLAVNNNKERVTISIFGADNEALVVRSPVAKYSQEGDELEQTLLVTLERRNLTSGEIVNQTQVNLGAALTDSSSPQHSLRHPKGRGYVLMTAQHLIAWAGNNQAPQLSKIPGPTDTLGWNAALHFLPDGSGLVVGSHRKLMLLNWPDLSLVAGPRYHDTLVSALATDPSGRRLLSGAGFGDGAGSSGYAQLWSLPELNPIGPRMDHYSQVSLVAFLGSGRSFVSSSESPDGSEILLSDASTALPLAGHLAPPNSSGQAFLTFSNYTEAEISTIEASGQVDAYGEGNFTTRIATPTTEVPEWFYEHFLPLAAGKVLTQQGTLKALSVSQLRHHYQQLIAALALDNSAKVYRQLANWYLENPSARVVAPFSELTLDQFLEDNYFKRLRAGKTMINPMLAYALDPSHPLQHLHIALRVQKPSTKANLINWGLKRLAMDANAAIYGKQRWLEQVRTGQLMLVTMKAHEAVVVLEQVVQRIKKKKQQQP